MIIYYIFFILINMNCYICQDVCLEENKKCNCDGYISYIHDECLCQMIIKTNNNICYFCDSEYKISKYLTYKINISNFYNNYLINNNIGILIFFMIFFIYSFFNVDLHISKEIYNQVLIETDII